MSTAAAATPLSPSVSSSSSGAATASQLTTIRRRRWVRREGGGPPFVWSGLWPTLGLAALALYALLPWARDDVQANVERGVQARLLERGMPWVKTSVSGQHVLLSGTPPDAAAAEQALAAAREATCPTWTGPRVCAVQVLGAFAAPLPAAATPPPAPPAPAVVAAPPAAAAQACEKSLASLLEGARIEFASGSAVIAARSAGLLDQLAAAARTCPGRITIEGHTDNVGPAAMNKALSQARAEAVRQALAQRGLPAERMGAGGFGMERPAAPNETAEGRARNRRIEFKAEP